MASIHVSEMKLFSLYRLETVQNVTPQNELHFLPLYHIKSKSPIGGGKWALGICLDPFGKFDVSSFRCDCAQIFNITICDDPKIEKAFQDFLSREETKLSLDQQRIADI